jgi:hypothetical protein
MEVRSDIYCEEEPTTINELDDSQDSLEDKEDASWEEPAHVTCKWARGCYGGKKVAARASRPSLFAGC